MTDLEEADYEPPEPIEGIFVDVARAMVIPPSWIIQDLIPPGLVFLAGPPKSKKSTITAAAAALVAEYPCTAMPEHLSQVKSHGPVLWLSAEALAGEIRHMMEHGLAMGPLEPREAILVAECPWDFRLDDPGALDTLLFWLKKRAPRLVIIDPFRDFHALEEKDSGGMNRLLRPLRRWAVDHDAAVVIVHHTKKLTSEDGREATYSAMDMRGTTALFGVADGVLMLSPRGKESEGRIHIQATFKRAAGWEKEITLAAYGSSSPAAVIPSDLENQVLQLTALGQTAAQICEILHVNVEQVNAALNTSKAAPKKGQLWKTRR